MESSRPLKSARAMRESLERDERGPRVLCWSCKQMTPFHADRCQVCGAKFAGSTGGMYASNHRRALKPLAARPPSSKAVAAKSVTAMQEELAAARRSLMQLVDDLQHVQDAPSPLPRRGSDEEPDILLFQCPSCGRFVSEAARECACGVRFAPTRTQTEPLYQCGHCGSIVSGDAARCSCGAFFKP